MCLMEYSVVIVIVVKWMTATLCYSRLIIAVGMKESLTCRLLQDKTILRPLLILVTKVKMRNAMRWTLRNPMRVQLERKNKFY